MKRTISKKKQKRYLNSWITSLISISLVLILLGALSLTLLNSRNLSEYIKEQIGFTIVLKDDLKEIEVIRLQKTLNASEYIKTTRYIDKETAAIELSAQLGEDFSGFLGHNPLFASLDIKLISPYTQTDSLKKLQQVFLNYPQVSEVYYQENIATLINQNIRKLSLILLSFSALLTIIFFGLINNTIRVLIYSQRFIINTMQMVGANNSYIRKPFLQRNLKIGFYGALIANIFLVVTIYVYKTELYGIITPHDLKTTGLAVLVVFVSGLVISFLSTWFALNKFLGLKFDELFY